MRGWILALAAAAALAPAASIADSAPDPDEFDAIILRRLREGGVACTALATVERHREPEADRLTRLGYIEQYVATCRGGPRVLLARARRRGARGANVTPFVQVLDSPAAAGRKR